MENIEAKRQAYEAAFKALMELIDNPDKTVPVDEYRVKLEAAAAARNKAYEEMWAAARPN